MKSYKSHEITIFPWFSHGFPMVFLWFSYGFPMVFPWFSYGFPMVFPMKSNHRKPPIVEKPVPVGPRSMAQPRSPGFSEVTMEKKKDIWFYMVLYGFIWFYMWFYVVLYGFIYGLIWIIMG